ncbi:unnamed protein product [Sphagnum compactum]
MLCAQASAAMEKLVVEYAKSGRATCKHCNTVIAKGSVRLGSVTKDRGHDNTKWHHPVCFVKNSPKSMDAAKLAGFTDLKDSDRDALGVLTVCTTDVEPSDKHDDKRIRIDVASASSEKEQKGQVMLYNAKLWEKTLQSFDLSQLSTTYKDACLPKGWKSFSSVIFHETEKLQASEKIAAFDFDGCLVKTDVRRTGAHAWSLLFPSIPEKFQKYHDDGYKLVIFSNESNIDRWKNSRQKAVDSKLGRVEGFLELLKVPVQTFISCGKEGTGDACRKPAPGMWHLMEKHLNDGIPIDKESSFYVGDAAGRKGDHSAADIGFAKDVGVKFLLPEEVF